jgi:hypothetical protein
VEKITVNTVFEEFRIDDAEGVMLLLERSALKSWAHFSKTTKVLKTHQGFFLGKRGFFHDDIIRCLLSVKIENKQKSSMFLKYVVYR